MLGGFFSALFHQPSAICTQPRHDADGGGAADAHQQHAGGDDRQGCNDRDYPLTSAHTMQYSLPLEAPAHRGTAIMQGGLSSYTINRNRYRLFAVGTNDSLLEDRPSRPTPIPSLNGGA